MKSSSRARRGAVRFAAKANGPLASLTFGSTPTRSETRTYDARYLPLTVNVSNSLFNWIYTTDNVGNVTTISQSQPTSHTRSFGYQDYQYFLTCAGGPWSAGGGCNPVSGSPLRWTFDKIGNRLTETRSGVTDTYSYVANGSGGRTPLLDSVTLGVGGARDYTFGPAGHLEALDAGANVVDFQNDAAGQLGGFSRAVDRVATMRYDGRGYLAEILTLQPGSGDGGISALGLESIFADGFEAGDICEWSSVVGWEGGGCPGEPVESLEEVVYDSAGRLHAILPDAGNDPSFVFYFGDRPVATYRGGPMASFTLLTTDHLGTPVHAMSTAGAALWSGGFEPYGRDFTTPTAASAGIFLRLPGQWNDGSWNDASLGTEVYYNVHRWLETGTGRYTRLDPLGLRGGSSNVFAYAYSNPMSWIDPRGLATVLTLPPTYYPVPWGDMGGPCGGSVFALFPPYGCTDPNFTIDCTCSCEQGDYRPSVSIYVEPEVYFATDSPHSPELIKSEENKHAGAAQNYGQSLIGPAGAFEQNTFDSFVTCKAACLAFQASQIPGLLTYDDTHDTDPHPYK